MIFLRAWINSEECSKNKLCISWLLNFFGVIDNFNDSTSILEILRYHLFSVKRTIHNETKISEN